MTTKSNVWTSALILIPALVLSGGLNAAPNILLIIGDDMGVETLASYEVGENPPATAALDELARQGVRFTNFWSQPICSPTRATMLTGRYGFRTGVGRPIAHGPPMPEPPARPEWATYEVPVPERPVFDAPLYLRLEEFTLPMAFKANTNLGYATAAIGKWHLANAANGWIDHPNFAGFDHFSGLIEGEFVSYFSWNKVVDGEVAGTSGYAPADKAEDAIRWIDERGDEPWFMWFAFNLPHIPMHLPPEDTWQSDHSHLDPASIPEGMSGAYFAAMIEAMDTQIGRILSSLDPDVRDNTYVIFLGDNGTAGINASPPFRRGRSKNSVYEGGVNVPLIVAGPGVAQGAVSEVLVNSTDLFATVMDMAGIDPAESVPDEVTHDSVSFLYALSDPEASSRRDWLYADRFNGSFPDVARGDYAMRDQRYKVVRFRGEEEFYDLREDPYENANLLTGELSPEEQAAHLSLSEQIRTLHGSERQSRDRMPPIAVEDMTASQTAAVAELAAVRGIVPRGPWIPLLRSPEVLSRARAMGDYLRYDTSLPPELSEFLILLTARQWNQQYEWYAHYQIALDVGINPDTVNAVAEGRVPEGMTDSEAILHALFSELNDTHQVSDETYARAVAAFGERGVIDAVGIIGYYTLLAMVMNTARTPVPAGAADVPPLPAL
ncbi:MAG: sulfatase-like hydrolase/transferase [Rhodospirillaceae bacterium]|nr:sulfatase-like hydrolase/transferase [Rhodospirillaceae bacterium]